MIFASLLEKSAQDKQSRPHKKGGHKRHDNGQRKDDQAHSKQQRAPEGNKTGQAQGGNAPSQGE
jgi:hypothetical protein